MLQYNLQLFAEGQGGEKTEDATPKKLEDARKEGQVAKSKEISVGFGLLFMFILLKIWVGRLGTQFLEMFQNVYNKMPEITSFTAGDVPIWDLFIIFRQVMLQIIWILAPFWLVAIIVGFVAEVLQVQWKPTSKPLQPKLSKLNPLSGFKKIFSMNSLFELGKSILKILLIGYIVYSTIQGEWRNLFFLMDMPLMQGIALAGDLVINLGIKISAFYIVLAFVDFLYQKWKFNKDMKMTKQEVKDEYKQSEGDPQIKGKIKQRMMQASQRRMMQDLPSADVVITNPTHFAVAIKYDPDKADAPFVVAKGCDHLAAKIKEVAKDNKVEIVENKPLARMLYHNVEIGQVIPPELYKAVADVLAYVYSVQGKINS